MSATATNREPADGIKPPERSADPDRRRLRASTPGGSVATGPVRAHRGRRAGVLCGLLAALVAVIALINMYNRFNVITQQPAGDYQPGMFG